MLYHNEFRGLAADYPFCPFMDASIAFLPLGSAINRVPRKCFLLRVVAMTLGTSRQFDYVAIPPFTPLRISNAQWCKKAEPNYNDNNCTIVWLHLFKGGLTRE
jgi:hypothetical protein